MSLSKAATIGILQITDDPTTPGGFIARVNPASGPMISAIYWIFNDFIGKKGVKLVALRKKKYGKAIPTELTKDDGAYVVTNRVSRLQICGIERSVLDASVEKAIKKVEDEQARNEKYKADAPKRKAEAAKYAAEKRKADMAEYTKRYGKGTWNRVTYKQEGGDDGYQYVVRVDGKAKWVGLTQREAMYYKEREVNAIAKWEKLGNYAEKNSC